MSEDRIMWRDVHLEQGEGNPTPAVKVTRGGRAMYSYTAGVLDREGHFRPYLHLSDTHINEFIALLNRAAAWVRHNSVRSKPRT